MRQSGGISSKVQPCLANPHWLTWVSTDLASHLSGSQNNWHTTVQSVRSNSMKVLSRNAKSNTVVTAADASVISAAVTLFRSQSLATLNLPVCVTAVVRKSSIMLTSLRCLISLYGSQMTASMSDQNYITLLLYTY